MLSLAAFASAPLVRLTRIQRTSGRRHIQPHSRAKSHNRSRTNNRRGNRAAMASPGSLRVAVVGCAHGELDAMYAAVNEAATARPDAAAGVDLIVCAGDFQAVRNEDDLECMAVPDKFKHMREFWRYYAGEDGGVKAPIPTVFVGGNHEASNHLQELPLGGLVAPNIYYLGPAGVVNFRGLRIGGLSGVYTAHNFRRPQTEAPPYPGNSLKSVYHTREPAVVQLSRIQRPLDMFLSHDWPTGIADYGDKAALLRAKPFLKTEIADGRFGSPASAHLLRALRPRYWFAAHVHVKFAALVPHPPSTQSQPTQFLALDKVLPRRDFVQILDIAPAPGAPPFSPAPRTDAPTEFIVDREWLAILRSAGRTTPVSEDECAEAEAIVKEAGLGLSVISPNDFEKTARVYDPAKRKRGERPSSVTLQKRSVAFAAALGIELSPVIQTHARQPVPVGVSQVAPELTAADLGEEGSASKRPRMGTD